MSNPSPLTSKPWNLPTKICKSLLRPFERPRQLHSTFVSPHFTIASASKNIPLTHRIPQQTPPTNSPKMPFGILEDTRLEHTPGTAPLQGHSDTDNYSGIDSSLLKYDRTGKIVLVPQPSDSPNDPYNWSRTKKELFTIAYGWGCGCVGGKLFAKMKAKRVE